MKKPGRAFIYLRALSVLLASWGGLAGFTAQSQPLNGDAYSLVLRGVPMDQSLEKLVHLTRMDLVYSTELVEGKYVYCAVQDAPAEVLLRCVLDRSGLEYVRSSSGAYVLIHGVEAPPRYGHLAGRIVDQDTGEPLPYAHVLLADASAGTTANESGLFSFASLLPGPHRLVVSYVGYRTASDSIWIAADRSQRLEIALQSQEVAMAPIVINGLDQRLPSSTLGTGALSGAQLTAYAASGTPDVARGAGSLPGVAVQQPLADLHIQGGAGGEHLTLLDGVPVRDPVSLGRHLSAFSPLAIKRLTVHKAGFGAEHGSHLAGVVAVEQDVATSTSSSVAFSADLVSLNGKVQRRFALPGMQPGHAMLALRHSLWGVYRDPGMDGLLRQWNAVDPQLAAAWLGAPVRTASLYQPQHRPSIAFSDLHAAVRLPMSPFRVVHASAFRAGNGIASDMTAVQADHVTETHRLLLTRDDYNWTNWAGQVRHSWLLGARSVANVQVLGSLHDSRYAYHALYTSLEGQTDPQAVMEMTKALRQGLETAPGSAEAHRIREVTLRTDFGRSISPRDHLEAGLDLTHTSSQVQFSNPFIAPLQHETDAWQVAGYLKGRFGFSLATTLEPSLRLTYVPLRQAVYAEPRLSLRYDRSQSRIGPYALRLAGGLYRQFTNTYELTSSGTSSVVPYMLFWLPVDRTVVPPRAYHLATEALLMPASHWTLQLEGYFKAQPHLLGIDYAALLAERPAYEAGQPPVSVVQDAFVSPSQGRAYGGSVRLERAGERGSGAVSYSFSRAVRRFPRRFDGQRVPAPWNEPHRLSLDAKAPLLAGLKLEANWRGAWGRRWALRRAYYDYLALRPEPISFAPFDLDAPSQQTLPPYYRLDLGLTYERFWGRSNVQIRAFVVNLLDRRNVFDQSLELSEDGLVEVTRSLPGAHPVLTLRVSY